MKTIVSEHDFIQAFVDYDRTANFTYEAREALFEYIEELEESMNEEFELDVIAICSEYNEYKDIDQYNNENDTPYLSRDDVEGLAVKVGDVGFVCYSY